MLTMREEQEARVETAPRAAGATVEHIAGPSTREFESFMKENARSVHRFLGLKGVQSRDVPDIAQQVFLLAHRKWGDFRGEASRRAWLFGIARNSAADYRKGRGRQQLAYESYGMFVESSAGTFRSPEERTQTFDDLRVLYDVLRDQKESVRNVFILYEIEGLTMAEVAAIEAIPEQTGYSRLRVARDAVMRRFAQLEGGGA